MSIEELIKLAIDYGLNSGIMVYLIIKVTRISDELIKVIVSNTVVVETVKDVMKECHGKR